MEPESGIQPVLNTERSQDREEQVGAVLQDCLSLDRLPSRARRPVEESMASSHRFVFRDSTGVSLLTMMTRYDHAEYRSSAPRVVIIKILGTMTSRVV